MQSHSCHGSVTAPRFNKTFYKNYKVNKLTKSLDSFSGTWHFLYGDNFPNFYTSMDSVKLVLSSAIH